MADVSPGVGAEEILRTDREALQGRAELVGVFGAHHPEQRADLIRRLMSYPTERDGLAGMRTDQRRIRHDRPKARAADLPLGVEKEARLDQCLFCLDVRVVDLGDVVEVAVRRTHIGAHPGKIWA